jgi:hypothetical protein
MLRAVPLRAARLASFAALAGFAALVLTLANSEPGEAAFPGLDGKVTFSVENGSPASIWTATPDGSFATRLTGSDWSRSPAFSPDGKRIAFERWNGVGDDVMVMNADGSGQAMLIGGEHQSANETSWEQDYETAEQPPRTIPDVKVQTTTSTLRSFEDPAFSPDGSQLAVAEVFEEHAFTTVCAVAAAEGEQCIGEGEPGAYFATHLACLSCSARIITISSTTGARTGDATMPPAGSYDLEPTFSADGKLAFRRETNGESAIFVADSAGATPRQLTFGGEDWSPDFSPDGSKLVFSQANELGIIGTGGGPVTIVPVPAPPGGEGFADSPVFSPDGTRIAFERGVFPQGTPGEGLYTIGLDGSGMSLLSADGFAPNWGPLVVAPPSPPPPAKAARAKARKGKLELSRKGKVTIGTVTCGSSPCTLSISSAKLKAGRGRCGVSAKLVKKLAPGKSAPLGVAVARGCMAALEKAGKGKLVTRVGVTDAFGRRTLAFRSTLVPPPGRGL